MGLCLAPNMSSQVVKALEFFCGIGGMHCALTSIAPQAIVLEAFDVSPIANEVYTHNFGQRINKLDLECITPQQLDAYAANLWMLSPPCQPHTRQGQQKGSQDHRSAAFSNLLNALARMQQPPQWLMLENVVGFDHSDVHKLMIRAFEEAGYHMQEFILSPLQYGIPYTRPRYFCLASKMQFPVALPLNLGPCQATPSLLLQLQADAASQQTIQAAAQQHLASHVRYVQTISEYLWSITAQQQQHQQRAATDTVPDPVAPGAQLLNNSVHHQEQQQQQQQQFHTSCGPHGCSHTGNSISSSCTQLGLFQVPHSVLRKYPGIIRVVTGSSRNSNCFTKSYSQFARGTGSLLAAVDPTGSDKEWQLAGGIGSLVHCNISGSAGTRAVVDSSRTEVGNSSLCEKNRIKQHAGCPGAVSHITLRPGEVLLTPHQQHQHASFHPSCPDHSSSNFSLQHLLLPSNGSADWPAQSGPDSCNATTSSSSAGCFKYGAGYHPPVVLRPGELVIAGEERQLYTDQEVQQLADSWMKLGIRYFTPLEIARLHSFPSHYSFPPGLTAKQCYQLLGNSLSVSVVADLLRYLLMSG